MAASDQVIVKTRSEVLIVGGGPAGTVAAIAAASRGLQATILDSRKPPIDKPCGESILPQGVAALKALGISLPPEDAFPFRGIRFADDEHSARANFAGATGYSMRRVKLHQLLVDRAVEMGVEFHWGARVLQIDSEIVTTATEKFSYRWLVGADGQNSQVRKWVGARFAHAPEKTVRLLQPFPGKALVGRGGSALGARLPDFYYAHRGRRDWRGRAIPRPGAAACGRAAPASLFLPKGCAERLAPPGSPVTRRA